VVSSRHLRELTGLPTDAVNHFNSEVANGTQRRRRSRRESVSGPTIFIPSMCAASCCHGEAEARQPRGRR
jgi:hypothetical protein